MEFFYFPTSTLSQHRSGYIQDNKSALKPTSRVLGKNFPTSNLLGWQKLPLFCRKNFDSHHSWSPYTPCSFPTAISLFSHRQGPEAKIAIQNSLHQIRWIIYQNMHAKGRLPNVKPHKKTLATVHDRSSLGKMELLIFKNHSWILPLCITDPTGGN